MGYNTYTPEFGVNEKGDLAVRDISAAGVMRPLAELGNPEHAATLVLDSGLVVSEVTDYTKITATGTVVTGPCELAGYDCIVAAGNITIYDGASTAGAVIVPTTPLAVGRVEFNFKRALKNGCHVVLSGAATVNVLATAT